MTCGVHLGILLICFFQAEHVRCLWATQDQSSQMQNSYAGLSLQDSRLRRLGGSYPQNQLRQASVQSSSLSTQTAANSASIQRLPSSGYTKAKSQPVQSGYHSVKSVQSSSVSKPNWQIAKGNQVNAQKEPKRPFSGLSAAIASGSSVSKYNKNQNNLSSNIKQTWPVKQGTPRTSKHFPSSPSSKTYSSHQSVAQRNPSTAPQTLAHYGQRAYSPSKSSSLFSAGGSAPQKPAQKRTSATAPARRVSSHHGSKAPRFPAPQNKVVNYPSQAQVGPYKSKLFSVDGGNSQGSYNPAATSNKASNRPGYSQSRPVSKQTAQLGFQPRSLEKPKAQRVNYQPSLISTRQTSSSSSTGSSYPSSWNSRSSGQGAHNLPASGSSTAGTSGQHFAPTRTHSIPKRFGGFAIRRLRDPVDQSVSVQKPQTYIVPSLHSVSSKPKVQSVHQESKWARIRPQQRN